MKKPQRKRGELGKNRYTTKASGICLMIQNKLYHIITYLNLIKFTQLILTSTLSNAEPETLHIIKLVNHSLGFNNY